MFRPISFTVVLCAVFQSACAFALDQKPSSAAAGQKIQFNRDIRPILSDNCFACHGPDKNKRKSGLRLDDPEQPFQPSKSGAIAIVRGKPDESELIKRLYATDEDELMPPPESHKKLTPRQKEMFRRWVAEGAEYQAHWAFIAPVKFAVPDGRNGIDFLVQQRLSEIGLKPSPEADRRTLARRLYFDLVGLPPKPEEVEAFVNDKSPDACEKLVDRLLASPHYGERMAIGWLDVVRYADTIGYHSDNPRNVWPYRDYVIDAFNKNKPFDRFTIEQVAGDLLPDATQETKVGSAFNRLLLSTEEGGAQAKDYEARMLTDRVRAIGAAWLGQTTGCAQCHDHKFDPFTQRDFYSLGAFFADIKEPVLGRREDGMMVLAPEQEQRYGEIETRLAALQKELSGPHPELAEAQAAWETAAADAVAQADSWKALTPERAVSERNIATLKIGKDGIVHATVRQPRPGENARETTVEAYRVTVKAALKGVTGFRIEALKEKSPGIGLAGNGNFVLGEVEAELPGKRTIKFANASATFEQPGFPAKAAIDGIADQKSNGWAVLGGTGADQALYLEAADELTDENETPVTFVFHFAWGENHSIANLRISATTAPKPVIAPSAARPPKELAEILKIEPEKRNAQQKAKLAQQFKQIAPQLADLRTRLESAEKEKKDFEAAAPKCLVSAHTDQARTVRILPRGNFMDESGEVMQPALPHYLPQPKIEDRKPTRLDLGQWLVSRENPLTARVVMNRMWKQFFGIGLSKVLDDLGTQGEPPVNPALLDWLACEFMDSHWDVKHMVRTIVTSQTYRQVSTASKELQARDPYNRELARQSRFRLDAELVRDNVLAVSGLLVPKIGGPSVKPYQPPGYWENLNFPVREWQQDNNENQWRRGLYTWWQRSFLQPSLLAFDAPSREECCAERNRSNIPQQALVLLNDPTYVEAARVFAARILKECSGSPEQRIAWAWRQALDRAPREDELKTARELLEKDLALYRGDTKAAESLAKVGLAPAVQDVDKAELAAWTSVARVILNLHEVITRS